MIKNSHLLDSNLRHMADSYGSLESVERSIAWHRERANQLSHEQARQTNSETLANLLRIRKVAIQTTDYQAHAFEIVRVEVAHRVPGACPRPSAARGHASGSG